MNNLERITAERDALAAKVKQLEDRCTMLRSALDTAIGPSIAVRVDAIERPLPGALDTISPRECRGFHWIGQPLTSCDNCGRPAWEHDGMDKPDGAFSTTSTLVPWEPGEAEAIRRKWDLPE